MYGSKDEHGNEFDLGNYPNDKDGELRFYTFVEYGYSYYANLDKNYALYMYLYNPQQLDFSTYLDSNVVRMATAFEKTARANTSFPITTISISCAYLELRAIMRICFTNSRF